MGQESREAVSTLGLDLSSDELTFEEVWAKLKYHYERDESEYVKVDKFVSCCQVSAESDRDYLLRCERLSRRCDFSVGDVRQRFTLSIAVRGLRDNVLKRELMANDRLDWASLNKTLRARTGAQESLSALGDGVYTVRVSNSASKSDTSTSRAAGGQSASTSTQSESSSAKAPVSPKGETVSEVRHGSQSEYSGDRRREYSRDRRHDSRDRRYDSRDRQDSRGRSDRRDSSRDRRDSHGDRDRGQSRRDDSRDCGSRSDHKSGRDRRDSYDRS